MADGVIFVGGIPYDVGNDELRDAFSAFGLVDSAVIVRQRSQPSKSRGFGYVGFADAETTVLVLGLEQAAVAATLLPRADWPEVTASVLSYARLWAQRTRAFVGG